MKTILIVDSDTEFRKQIKELVNPDQVKIMTTTNGSEVVRSAGDTQPDAIILNLELKDMNGFLVCSSLKKSPLTKEIPVLITSDTKGEEDFEQHRKLKFRADGYYRKPLSKEDLSAILLETLGASAVRSDLEHPLASEFTEENIDKLLDSTFLDAAEESETSGSLAEVDEEIPLEIEDKEPEPEPKAPISDDLSLRVEDISDDFEAEEPEPAPAPEKAKPEPASKEDVHTVSDNANVLEPLKQELRETTAKIISLEKENEFLTSENRNLLMNITTLKADIEEKVALDQKKTTELEEQIGHLEAGLSEMTEKNRQLNEQADSEKHGLEKAQQQIELQTGRLEELTEEFRNKQNEIDRIKQERDEAKAKAITAEQERDEARQELSSLKTGFEEKEAMLMTTIENLTKNTRELEDQNKKQKERLDKLGGVLRDAVKTVDLSEE